MNIENSKGGDLSSSVIAAALATIDGAGGGGFYEVECIGPDGNVKWRDTIDNVWCSQGMEAVLTHALKGSAYTAAAFLGLITSSNYTAVAYTNTAANITTASGTPTNGWNEAPSSVATPRGTPSFGTASSSGTNSDLATSASVSFSILASATIKGCFLIIKDKSGTSPTSAVGNTSGAILSAGTFTGGDKVVGNGDTLNVSYTARLTTS